MTSDDPEVLARCVSVVDQRAAREDERGRSAESRATGTLAAIAIVAGFGALLASAFDNAALRGHALMLSLFGGAGLFLAKAAFSGIRALGVRQYDRLTHQLAETLQRYPATEALRVEISWKQWEIDQMIPVANERLFWVARSQRNTLASVMCLLLMAADLFLVTVLELPLEGPWGWLVLAVVILAVLCADPLLEKRGPWTRDGSQPVARAVDSESS